MDEDDADADSVIPRDCDDAAAIHRTLEESKGVRREGHINRSERYHTWEVV